MDDATADLEIALFSARKQLGREARKREDTVRHVIRLESAHVRTARRLRVKVADCDSLKAVLGPEATKEWARLRAIEAALQAVLAEPNDAAWDAARRAVKRATGESSCT